MVEYVFEVLKDKKWHKFDEFCLISRGDTLKVKVLLDFLARFSFAEINRRQKKARLSKTFADFLEGIELTIQQ